MLYDTHAHTRFSFDSRAALEGMLAAAKAKGLGICTTEHLDLNFMEVAGFPIDFDIDSYFSTYGPFRGEGYLMGIEIGLDFQDLPSYEAIVKNHPFDVVVGSLHTMDKKDLSNPKTFEGIDAKGFYRAYLQYARRMVEAAPFIDVLAHFDYPTRYSGYQHLLYEDFPQEFDGLFRALVAADTTLEINTKTPLDAAMVQSYRSVYGGYRRQGGRYVTLASDAHRPQEVGRDFDGALELVRELGLIPCHYERRTRCPFQLKQE